VGFKVRYSTCYDGVRGNGGISVLICYVKFFSRSGSALTQARLQAVQNCGTVRHEGREKHDRSPSLNLLLRFQRLLIAQIYSHSHKMKSWNSQQGKLSCAFKKLLIGFYLITSWWDCEDVSIGCDVV